LDIFAFIGLTSPTRLNMGGGLSALNFWPELAGACNLLLIKFPALPHLAIEAFKFSNLVGFY